MSNSCCIADNRIEALGTYAAMRTNTTCNKTTKRAVADTIKHVTTMQVFNTFQDYTSIGNETHAQKT